MSEMTTEGKHELWLVTLWPLVVSVCLLGLLSAFVLSFHTFADGYVNAVGGVSSAGRASKVTTTWPDGEQSHAVQTARQPGQTVADWGQLHVAETNGLMVEIGARH